jgi:mono/diheme cytochrome c family protein
MAVGLPIALLWFFAAASSAGVPVAEIFGSATAGARDLIASMFSTATTGYPIAQRALRVAFASITATILLVFALFFFRRERFGRLATGLVMLAALFAIGGSEWVREGLRKPYVIGSYVFVNGLRMPPPQGAADGARRAEDPLRLDAVAQNGVLATAHFVPLPASARDAATWDERLELEAGQEVFRLLCSECHTVDGYLAVRRLVRGRSSSVIEGLLPRLAAPREGSAWTTPHVQLATWRDRRMPPFAGTPHERRALAVFLATLGGGKIEPHAATVSGAAVFEAACAMCHDPGAGWPIASLITGRSETDLYDAIGRLPQLNEAMPPFEGTDEERRALAKHLAGIARSPR